MTVSLSLAFSRAACSLTCRAGTTFHRYQGYTVMIQQDSNRNSLILADADHSDDGDLTDNALLALYVVMRSLLLRLPLKRKLSVD